VSTYTSGLIGHRCHVVERSDLVLGPDLNERIKTGKTLITIRNKKTKIETKLN